MKNSGTEADLLMTLETYRHLFDNLNDAAFLADASTGMIIETNRRGASLLGRSHSEITSMHQSQLHPPGKAEEYRQRFETHVRQGHIADYDGEVIRKDGTAVPVAISASTFALDGRQLILGLFRDITERKQAEVKIRQSENRYRLLAENVTDVIWTVDINNPSRLTYISPSVERLLGYSIEEAMAREMEEAFTPASVKTIMKAIAEYMYIEARESNDLFRSKTMDLDMYHKDGSIVPVEVNCGFIRGPDSRPVEILVVARDVTQRKQAETALRESEEHYHFLFETMAQGVQYKNAEGKFISCNPSAERILGLTLDQMAERTPSDPRWQAIHEDGSDFAVDTLPSNVALRTGQAVRNVVMGAFNPVDEKWHWLNVNAVPVFKDGESKPYQVYTTFEEITQRKQAEEALRESEEKYRDLLDNTSDIVQSITADGHFRYVNNGWKQALGYSENEISDLKVFDIIHPDYLSPYKVLFDRMRSGEDVGRISTTFIGKNGRKIIVEGNVTCNVVGGELLYTRCIFHDVTKSKYLEEQMFRLSSALSMSTDCIVITDFDARIIDVNGRMLELYGTGSKEELVGRHFLELIVPSERLKVNMDVMEIMERGSLESKEYAMVSRQGHRFTVQMSTSLVKNADGEPMGMVRVGRALSKPDTVEKSHKTSPASFIKKASNS